MRQANLSVNDYGCFPHLRPDPNCPTLISFLRGFLSLKHGVPMHGAFSRLFRALDPELWTPISFAIDGERFMA